MDTTGPEQNTRITEPQVKLKLIRTDSEAIGATIKAVRGNGEHLAVHLEDGRVWLLKAIEDGIYTEPHPSRSIYGNYALGLYDEAEFQAWESAKNQRQAAEEKKRKREEFDRLKKEFGEDV